MVRSSNLECNFRAILQEKVAVQALSAVCFTVLLLIFTGTLYSVKNKDGLVNRSDAGILPTHPSKNGLVNRSNATILPTHASQDGLVNRSNAGILPTHPSEDGLVNRSNTGILPTHPSRGPSIESFWPKITQAPRVLHQCADASCTVKLPQDETQSPTWNSTSTCPLYFHWIYEDLAPWMESGISLDLLEQAKASASFRVIIKGGRLFIEPYHLCPQTRLLFTIWGLLQLLEYYSGLVPDVDLMFSCEDRPVMKKKKFRVPPPVFRYCSTTDFWDIPFPDWSFWGWSEINISPWDSELSSIVKASRETKWAERHPTAYWKGNPYVADLRQELVKCNSSKWGAQIYQQDWITEGSIGFAHSKLADQCNNRYKIYAEGWAWSVSLKYILACNSPALLITPKFHDFFTRGLVPQSSYWPVRYKKMCESIKFAVDWGNSNPAKAKKIGKAGQEFMAKEVSMPHVYDYMLHLLTQYSKLLRFKPNEVVAANAREVCSNEVLCLAQPVEKHPMEQSMVKKPSSSSPCSLASRDPELIRDLVKRQRRGIRQIESWEDSASKGQPTSSK